MKRDCLLIAGGPDVTIDPRVFLRVFDTVFIGEVEDVIVDFVRDFRGGVLERAYVQETPVDISDILPDRSILSDDYVRTSSIFTGNVTYCEGGSTSIMFSRGCPSACAFCCSPKLYNRRVRFRSVVSILEEVDSIIAEYGIRQFRVQDDTFTLNHIFLTSLTSGLESRGIYYRCSTRADRIDEGVVKLLYNSGCREIGLGVEAADNDVLVSLRKDETLEQIDNAITIIKKYPILIRCFFMMGLPSDSEVLMDKNIAFIEKHKLDHVTVCNFVPFPGTQMYEKKEDYGIVAIKPTCCMNIASHIPLVPNITCIHMTEEQHIKAMKKFYDYLLEKKFVH
jgi:radical SAM superfamily enzyme YgiQ (UPF0313 family)